MKPMCQLSDPTDVSAQMSGMSRDASPNGSVKSQYSASVPFKPLQETLILVAFQMNPNSETFVTAVLSALKWFFPVESNLSLARGRGPGTDRSARQ